MLKMWQFRRKLFGHRLVIETTEGFWGNEDFALRVVEHEGKLALAEDRHDRIGDGADMETCQV